MITNSYEETQAMKPAKLHSSSNPDPVDIHVGGRVRLRRTLLSMSQEKLASALGITFQQVQKYENGTNRVGASRLFHIAKVLKVPVSFFFEGYHNADATDQVAESQEGLEASNMLNKKETVDLVRAYYTIEDPIVRKKFLEMIKTFAKTQA